MSRGELRDFLHGRDNDFAEARRGGDRLGLRRLADSRSILGGCFSQLS
jgi:hypothetical protein